MYFQDKCIDTFKHFVFIISTFILTAVVFYGLNDAIKFCPDLRDYKNQYSSLIIDPIILNNFPTQWLHTLWWIKWAIAVAKLVSRSIIFKRNVMHFYWKKSLCYSSRKTYCVPNKWAWYYLPYFRPTYKSSAKLCLLNFIW